MTDLHKRVLCLLVPGFEEIEAVAPVDLLRRAGADVVMASVTGETTVPGRCGLVLTADTSLSAVASDRFDLLLLPGGPGVMHLRKDGRPAELAAAFMKAGKPIGAICAAPTVLADAGLLEGKQFTAHFSVHQELKGVSPNQRVVRDGNLITARGAGTAVEFGLALVKELFGEAIAQEIAEAIMW